ncbi:MAG: hypothetical protein IT426_20470 [Pirellulales bacterium]|nr:hypothetical protein [Pirellulales bacterium]
MPLPNWRDELPGRVRAMQIIVAALVMGCVVFAVVAIVVSPLIPTDADSKLVTYLALGVAVLAMIPRAVVPTIIVATGRKKILGNLKQNSTQRDAGTRGIRFDELEEEAGRQAISLLQSKLIVSAALIEGPTFFLLVAYMLECSPIALAAAGIMALLLALHFPSFGRAAEWIEGQLRLLKEEYS